MGDAEAQASMMEFIKRRQALLTDVTGARLLNIVMAELDETERSTMLFKQNGIEHIDLGLLPYNVLAIVHGFMSTIERNMHPADGGH